MTIINSSTGFMNRSGNNYVIQRSLRFNRADSAYLERTFSTPNPNRAWFSGWVKKTQPLTGSFPDNSAIIFLAQNSSITATYDGLYFFNENLYIQHVASGTVNGELLSNRLFRDSSSWYHIFYIFDSTQTTANNRMRLWINGIEETSFSSRTNPPLNHTISSWGSSDQHSIGRQSRDNNQFFPGYMTEIHSATGNTPSVNDFGFFENNVWKPKQYTGTYTANGFYLNFSDNSNTTATTLGRDYSGSSNNFTPTNFSVTAGIANDSFIDTPTSNYPIHNIYEPTTGSDGGTGNLRRNGGLQLTSGTTSSDFTQRKTGFFVNSGTWYFEVNVNLLSISPPSSGSRFTIGVVENTHTNSGYGANHVLYNNVGDRRLNDVTTAYGATYDDGDIIGCLFDFSTGNVTFYKNGVSQGAISSALTSGIFYSPFVGVVGEAGSVSDSYLNCGQRPFAYTIPSGANALYDATISGSSISNTRNFYNILTYTGSASSQTFSTLNFSPDLVIIKAIGSAEPPILLDNVNGANYLTMTNNTALTSVSGFSLNSNGFTVPANTTNLSTTGTNYISYCFDENVSSGFDIVSYTGNDTTNRNISHGLGSPPRFAFVKRTDSTGEWYVYHRGLNTAAHFLRFGFGNAQAVGNSPWGTGNWSSTQFMISNNATNNTNASGANYTAYLFSEVSGFSRFGSYTGNGSSDGSFIYTGFKPRLIFLKNITTGSTRWQIIDDVRNPINQSNNYFSINSALAEQTDGGIDFLSNGFKLRNTAHSNQSGDIIIYAAFADVPFKFARSV